MDIFKFDLSAATSGEVINGADSKMWIERYLGPGEFTVVGKLSAGLQTAMPIGSLVSHTNTMDVMLVENHQIVEDNQSDPQISITGRSLDAYLEQRIVGMNQNWASPPPVLAEYSLGVNPTWTQVVALINDHILVGQTIDSNNAVAGLTAAANVTLTGTEQIARVIQRGNVSERVIELLKLDNLGIRVIRKNTFGYPLGSNSTTTLLIHNGSDKTAAVNFSWTGGEIEGAEYLQSLKSLKNAALVSGRYVETMVTTGANGFNRRVAFVDAQDLDSYLSAAPTGGTLTTILAKMAVRGNAALKAQSQTDITRTDISKNIEYQYRTDYNIGDKITVSGNRGATAVMRVTEYVEIEDENGSSGHPTLALT